MADFKKYMVKALNFEFLMSLPLVLYFVLFSREYIYFLAGPGYEGAIAAMQIITVAVVPNGLTGILGVQVLTSLEKEKFVLYSVIVGAVSDFLLNLVFIPRYGAAGAAFATTIAEFLVLFVQIYYTRDLLITVRKDIRAFYYLIICLLSGAGAWFVKSLSVNGFLKLVISAIVFFGIYGIGLLIAKEPIVVDVLTGIKNKFRKK